jgi:peptide deformylase
MAKLDILTYPDPRLHKVAKPVEVVDDRIRQLVKDMAETMYEAPGIGLAATQVDVHERVIVIDISESRDELMVFINPEVTWASENRKVWEEGCLSVPEVYDRVERPDRVKVRALDEKGERSSSTPTICSLYVYSTRSITSMARYSWNTCRHSSSNASRASSRSACARACKDVTIARKRKRLC